MSTSASERGVTLVELAVVLTIMAIVLGWAVPAMAQWVHNIRASALAGAFLSDLQLARSEAIRRGAPAVLCARAGPVCGEGGWESGWLLFADTNDNARLDPGEETIREAPAAPHGWRFRGNSPVARYVAYHPLGQTKMVNGAFQAGTLTLCPGSAGGGVAYKIVINSHGRPRLERGPSGSCD